MLGCDGCSSGTEKKTVIISPSEWDLLQELSITLKPFLTATEFLSGQHYVSISGVAPVVCNLTAKLKKMNNQQENATEGHLNFNEQSSTPNRLAEFQRKTISQLSSRWDFKSDPGNGFLIAAALDPRFHSLKFLGKIDGSCSKFDVRKAISSMALQMELVIVVAIIPMTIKQQKQQQLLHLVVHIRVVMVKIAIVTTKKQRQ
jgi:hypothetical protein